MKKLFFIFAISLICLCGYPQNITTQGKDFWLSFMPNNWPGELRLEVLVASKNPCNGTVANPLTGWSAPFSVTPGVVTKVLIPKSQGLVEKFNNVEHKALHVTASDTVSLYMSNFITATYDASNVLPTSILLDNYIAVSYKTDAALVQNGCGSRFLIVAIENNTTVEIDPKGGWSGKLPLGMTRTISLNAGECYMVYSATGDVSGSSIKSKDGKKIAVFSGCDAQIPLNGCCFDAIFEQCLPLAYWGRHFVVTATALRECDKVRVTSIASGCIVKVDGKKKKVLSAKQTYEFELDAKKEAVYIETSSPAMVCVYLPSASYAGIKGDPSMVNINPLEQQMDVVTFATFDTDVSRSHFVNVVTLSSNVAGMKLDGQSISHEFKPVGSKPGYSYAMISVSNGSHTLSADKGGFVAHVYGLGSYESYAYTVGSNSKVLNKFDENGEIIIDPTDDEEGDDDDFGDDTLIAVDEPPVLNIPTDTLPEIVFNNISIEALKRDDVIKVVVIDNDNNVIDLENIDIKVDVSDDYLFDSVSVAFEDDSILFHVHPKGDWCDCFMPDELRFKVTMTPKQDVGSDDAHNRKVVTIRIPVVKENSWLSRCMWLVITIGALFLLLFYLIALLKKNRFRKESKINEFYTRNTGLGIAREEKVPVSHKLRKKGLFPWLNRWLNPFVDEKNSIRFAQSNNVTISFEADGNPNSYVKVDKKSFDEKYMSVRDCNPAMSNAEEKKNKYFRWSAGCNLSVVKDRTNSRLVYVPGSNDDVARYKMVVGILIAAVAVAILVLLVLMIRGV